MGSDEKEYLRWQEGSNVARITHHICAFASPPNSRPQTLRDFVPRFVFGYVESVRAGGRERGPGAAGDWAECGRTPGNFSNQCRGRVAASLAKGVKWRVVAMVDVGRNIFWRHRGCE